MSAEVTRHALTVTRETLKSRLPELLAQGDSLEAVICLLDGGGNRLDVAWHRGSRPSDPLTTLRLLVAQAEARAVVFMAEFQRDLANLGTQAAVMAWSFPEDGFAEASFWILEESGEVVEVEEGVDPVGPCLLEWLDERLVKELSEKS